MPGGSGPFKYKGYLNRPDQEIPGRTLRRKRAAQDKANLPPELVPKKAPFDDTCQGQSYAELHTQQQEQQHPSEEFVDLEYQGSLSPHESSRSQEYGEDHEEDQKDSVDSEHEGSLSAHDSSHNQESEEDHDEEQQDSDDSEHEGSLTAHDSSHNQESEEDHDEDQQDSVDSEHEGSLSAHDSSHNQESEEDHDEEQQDSDDSEHEGSLSAQDSTHSQESEEHCEGDQQSPSEKDGAEDSVEVPVPTDFSPEYLKQTLLIFAMKLRHRLTYEAAEDMVKLAGVLTSQSISGATKYFWKKTINAFSKGLSIHHVCANTKCMAYLGPFNSDGYNSEDEDDCDSNGPCLTCSSCGLKVTEKESLKAGTFFMYHSLGQQIKDLIEVAGEKCDYREARKKLNKFAYEDIFDGSLFKRLVPKGMLSVNFSVDGVPVFDSSNYKMSPLVCTLNDLEPKKRGEHLMLCGLWCGMNLNIRSISAYLKPFVEESQQLYRDGIKVNVNGSIQVKKVQVLLGISDSIQRPVLRCCKQFNGLYGCGLCLHTGIEVPKGKGTTRVYPLKDSKGRLFDAPLRTHEETLEHARDQTFGVLGKSILVDIPNFDIISCLDLDWAHAVLFGVVRQFTDLMFLPTYHKKDFSMSKKIGKVDKYLLSIKPSLEVSRTPRKISKRSNWKMHEWAIWLFFYSLPTLKTFMKKKKYVSHWALLVEGISILAGRSILKTSVEYARQCLIRFVLEVPKLYGLNQVSFNVHLLLHLADSVINFSCLWTHSTFIYEDCYQEFLAYVKSSNGVLVQVRDSFRMRSVVKQLLIICMDSLSEKETQFLEKLLTRKMRSKPTMRADGAALLGRPIPHKITEGEYFALRRIHVDIQRDCPVYSFDRAVIEKEIVQTKNYSRVSKRNSYVVLLKNNELFEIDSFIVVDQQTGNQCFAIGKYYVKTGQPFIDKFHLSHLIVLRGLSQNVAAVNVKEILEKVTYFDTAKAEVSLACVHPNHTELLS